MGMRRVYTKALDGFFFLFITLLLIYDYFPNLILKEMISKDIIIWIIVGTVLISFFFKEAKNHTAEASFKSQLFGLIYIFFLMIALKIAGGESSVGISFDSGFFYIVLIIALVQLVIQWKKMRESKLE